jgi:opacity protein-like surface antigen
MKKILVIIAVLVSTGSFAQRSFWSFNYPISVSMGEQKDYIDKASFRGIGIDGRGFLDSNISIGGSFSWEVFDEIKRDLPPEEINVGIDNVVGEITGVQYRFINTLPIMVNGHYYLGSDGSARPYFGLGLGTSYVEQRTDIGFVSITGKKWGFAVQPEVGVLIPFGLTGAGANISGKFRYTTKTVDTLPISFFTLSVGLGFMN